MKVLKLSALAAAVFGSSMAMAATEAVVINDADTVVVTEAPAKTGVVASTTNAVTNTANSVFGASKTLFNTAVNPAAISAEIGTLGYGANIAWGLNETTELQAGWTGMNFDGDKDLDANDSWINYDKVLGDGYGNYEGELKYDVDFSNPYIGVQMRPWANNFTVGTGVMVPRNKLKASITADNGPSNVSIDGTDYDVESATIKAENKNKIAPYLTVGYRPNITEKWGVFGEIGAAYMGKLEAKVTSDAAATAQGFNEAAKNEIEEDNFWYPIVKAGATYRF